MDNRGCGLKHTGRSHLYKSVFILTLTTYTRKVDLHGCSVNTWGCRALAASVLDISNEGTHHGVGATAVVRLTVFADCVSRYRKFLTTKKRSHEDIIGKATALCMQGKEPHWHECPYRITKVLRS